MLHRHFFGVFHFAVIGLACTVALHVEQPPALAKAAGSKPPVLTASAVRDVVGTPIPLKVSAQLVKGYGDDPLVLISWMPPNAMLDSGLNINGGQWIIRANQAHAVSITVLGPGTFWLQAQIIDERMRAISEPVLFPVTVESRNPATATSLPPRPSARLVRGSLVRPVSLKILAPIQVPGEEPYVLIGIMPSHMIVQATADLGSGYWLLLAGQVQTAGNSILHAGKFWVQARLLDEHLRPVSQPVFLSISIGYTDARIEPGRIPELPQAERRS